MKILDKLDIYLDEACPGDKKKSKGKGKGLGKGKGKGPIGNFGTRDERSGPSPRKKGTLGFVGAMKKYGFNEETWHPGMWVRQELSNDENNYALLVSQLKNKGWSAIVIADWRPIAGKKSIAHSYPPFEPIEAKDVPNKLRSKVEKKLDQLGLLDLIESIS